MLAEANAYFEASSSKSASSQLFPPRNVLGTDRITSIFKSKYIFYVTWSFQFPAMQIHWIKYETLIVNVPVEEIANLIITYW